MCFACLRQGREVRLRTSKSGKPRTLPLDGDLWDLMERRWTAREFTREDGTAACPNSCSTAATVRPRGLQTLLGNRL